MIDFLIKIWNKFFGVEGGGIVPQQEEKFVLTLKENGKTTRIGIVNNISIVPEDDSRVDKGLLWISKAYSEEFKN